MKYLAIIVIFLRSCILLPDGDSDAGDKYTRPLGEIQMAYLDEVRVEGTDLTITFMSVVSDSRCPSDVRCFWGGEASVELRLEQSISSATIYLSTIEWDDYHNTVDSLGYHFELLAVDPYPENYKVPIPKKDYVITLSVTR